MSEASSRARARARVVRVLLVVVAGWLLGDGAAWAQAQVGARLDKARVEVGEPFDVIVVATAAVGRTLDLAPNLPLGEVFEEITRREEQPRQLGAEVQEAWVVTMVALEPGKQTLPALPILVGGEDGTVTMTTAPLGIEVASVIGDGPAELRPISAPVTIWRRDLGTLWVALGVLGGLIVLGLVVGALRQRVRRAADEAAAPPPIAAPEVVALNRLRVVEAEIRSADDPRPAHFHMSEIVREYLGRRFAFDALEKTTDELAAALTAAVDPTGGAIDEVLRGELLAWLGARDLIKFARVPISRGDSLRAVAQAIEFVERTRPRPAVVTARRDEPPAAGPAAEAPAPKAALAPDEPPPPTAAAADGGPGGP